MRSVEQRIASLQRSVERIMKDAQRRGLSTPPAALLAPLLREIERLEKMK